MCCVQITKSVSKKKDSVMYSFRQSVPIVGMIVYLFETPCKLLFDYILLVRWMYVSVEAYRLLLLPLL